MQGKVEELGCHRERAPSDHRRGVGRHQPIARIENAAARAFHCFHVRARQCRDTAQTLHEIQRSALAGKQCASGTTHLRDQVAVFQPRLEAGASLLGGNVRVRHEHSREAACTGVSRSEGTVDDGPQLVGRGTGGPPGAGPG